MFFRLVGTRVEDRAFEEHPGKRDGQKGKSGERYRYDQVSSAGTSLHDCSRKHPGTRDQARNGDDKNTGPLRSRERHPSSKNVAVEPARILHCVRENNIALPQLKITFPIALIHVRIIASRVL